jgi:hypothetical protein
MLQYPSKSREHDGCLSRVSAVVGIGAVLFILQQFAGINGVLYFSSTTFKEAGIGSDMLASAAVAASNLVGKF